MKEKFDNYCQGSLEILEGKVLYKIAENIRNGLRIIQILIMKRIDELWRTLFKI